VTGNIDRKLAGSVNTTMSKFTNISQLLSWNSHKGCPKADKGPAVMSWCPFDPGKAAILTTSGHLASSFILGMILLALSCLISGAATSSKLSTCRCKSSKWMYCELGVYVPCTLCQRVNFHHLTICNCLETGIVFEIEQFVYSAVYFYSGVPLTLLLPVFNLAHVVAKF